MKIERISENQIRCTLSKHDLMERHLKISELAYGSEKAKDLFRDMMEQANIDFGFEADDIPLMIEAIPTSKDSIVLVITKVDNPEEFDERFSKFGIQEEDFDEDDIDFDADDEDDDGSILNAPDVVNCFEQLHELIEKKEIEERKNNPHEFIPLSEAIQKTKKRKKEAKKKKEETLSDKVRVYSFLSLNGIIKAARLVSPIYSGRNSVWKDESHNRYYLLLNRSNNKSSFQAACTTISEFGKEEIVTYATQDYFNEHFQIIIKDKALEQLSKL